MTTRRGFLRGVSGAALTTMSGTLAVACSSGTNSPSKQSGTRSGELPTYRARTVVNPDFPELDNGAPAAFRRYPANPQRTSPEAPADGGEITILKRVDAAIPPTMERNPFWQELNQRVGATLSITHVNAADYPTKLATTLAGGTLPDLVQMTTGVPRLPDLLRSQFEDLSPWLAGAKSADYPNLAAIPSIAWKNVLFNGGIYGVPYPLNPVGNDIKIRLDLATAAGFDGTLSNGDDLLALCRALTQPARRRWAIESITAALYMTRSMAGAPNTWRVDDGAFTHEIETDEYRQALDITTQMWKAGYIYPDSLGSTAGRNQWFAGGITAIRVDGFTNWAPLTREGLAATPDYQLDGLVLPKWNGGGVAGHYLGSGMFTFTALKKGNKERIAELLRVLDWFAAPFGAEEHLFTRYGMPGRHYELKDTDPIANATGTNECAQMNISYLATSPSPLYLPGLPDVTERQYNYLGELMGSTVPLPTVGLFSGTELSKGLTLGKKLQDLRTDIITGRKSLSEWDSAVSEWRSGGGDKIKQEYADALEQVES